MPNNRARRNDGFYFVVVDGVPQYCQWQELKDYLRESAKVRPGHTNVVKVNEDGTRVGFCPLPNKTEANRAFEYLVAEGWRGLDIRVSLVWKSDLGSDEIERRRGPEQSRRRRLPAATPHLPFPSKTSHPPRQMQPAAAYEANSGNTAFYTPGYTMSKMQSVVTPILPSYFQFTPSSDHSPSHSTSSVSMQFQTTPRHKHNGSWGQFPDMRYITQTSVPNASLQRYAQSTNADYRSIHISRLPNDVTHDHLLAFLQRFGPLSSLDIQRTNDQRFSATARFHSAEQAALAVQELHGYWWRNRRLVAQRARLATESIESEESFSSKCSDSDSSRGQRLSDNSDGRSGPLVVDGARGRAYHKRRKRDDDSASLEDGSSAEEECSCDS